jgi:hypothetical protein
VHVLLPDDILMARVYPELQVLQELNMSVVLHCTCASVAGAMRASRSNRSRDDGVSYPPNILLYD